jgi:MFS family permease
VTRHAGGASASEGKSSPRYGWVIVGASILLLAGFLATPTCFGLFIRPLGDEFGWSRAAVSGAMSLSMAVSAVVGVFMGRLSDRYNASVAIGVGLVAGAASYLAAAATTSLWQFYLCFGLGVGVCTGSCYSPVTATISKWFTDKRALAIGTSLTGVILGQMAFSPVISRVITGNGWRAGLIALAIITFALGLPGMILMTRKSKSKSPIATSASAEPESTDAGALQGYTTGQAARTAPFWMLMVSGFAVSFGYYILISHVPPYAMDLGISEGAASLVLTVSGLGGLGGTLLAWWMTVRLSARRALIALCVGQAICMALFIATRSVWSFYLVATVYGFVFGAATPVRMSMVAPLFGLRSVGALLGWATFAWSTGGIASPYLTGYIHDATGSYMWAFIVCGVLLLVSAVIVAIWGDHKKGTRETAGEVANI